MTNVHLEQKRNQVISPPSPRDQNHSTPNIDQLEDYAQCHKKNDATKVQLESNRKWWHRTRIHVALLGLTIAAVNCYAQATFCIAIVEMVLPADYKTDAPPLDGATASTTIISGYEDGDQSCPVDYKYRDYYDSWRFSTSTPANTSNASGKLAVAQVATSQTIDVSNRFDWDASHQGLLLGAFAVGTAPLQIAGGRLAEIYGSKWVLLMGCIGTGLTNLAIPYLAHFSFVLLLVNRVVMGIAQAGMEPGLMCLLADWLTPQEAGFFISMLLFAICLGFFLGSLCSSFILGLGYGWALAYYISGGLNLLVALIWYIYADSWPRASKYISEDELRFIEQEKYALRQQEKQQSHHYQQQQQQQQQQQLKPTANDRYKKCPNQVLIFIESKPSIISTNCGDSTSSGLSAIVDAPNKLESVLVNDPLGAPWRNILNSRAVWAFIICKISIRWCADVLSNVLPIYLANVLHLSIKINGLLNSVSAALFAISSFLTGWLATSQLCLGSTLEAVGHDDKPPTSSRSKTRLRKCFQSLASFGSALCLILMTQFDCDLLVSTSMLLLLSCCVVMGTGGELQIPYDMTSRYPGTLHGLACTLSVSGWLAPPLIGQILAEHPSSRARWSIVWYSTAAINLIGGLIFVLFADASPCDFDKPPGRCGSRRQERAINSATRGNADKEPIDWNQNMPNKRGDQGAYINDGLHNSSCESSPKSAHHTNHNNHDQQQQQQQQQHHHHHHHHEVEPDDSKAMNPLDATITFDCGKLIKCRQFESSFIQRSQACQINSYLNDSPLRQNSEDLIYPYREHQRKHPNNIEYIAPANKQASKQTVSSNRLQALESKERSPPPWHQRFFASKKRPPSSTIRRATPLATNEKFMHNEQAPVTTTTTTTSTSGTNESSETINHSIRSHDNKQQLDGSDCSARSFNHMGDKLNCKNDVHSFHSDTNYSGADSSESNLIENTAATMMSTNKNANSSLPSIEQLATNFDNHDHPPDNGRVPQNYANEFELNPNTLLGKETSHL